MTEQNDTSEDGADESGGDGGGEAPASLVDLRFVGPATESALSAADVSPADVVEKRVSYRDLLDADVNPGVAARVRREHSLSWSFESSGDDLSDRSAQIRGLGDAERAWVAASTGDWEEETADAETDGSGSSEAAEAAWRARSAPEPVTALDAVDEEAANRLAEGGITSVRALAAADPDSVSDALGLDVDRVRSWVDAARSTED